MLCTGEMVMITMAIGCVWSFREAGGEVEEEEAAAAVVEAWGRQETAMVPRPGAQKTEWLCQVGNAFHMSFS